MVILETSVFTRQVRQLLTDDELRGLQLELEQEDLTTEQLKRLKAIIEDEYP